MSTMTSVGVESGLELSSKLTLGPELVVSSILSFHPSLITSCAVRGMGRGITVLGFTDT